MHYMHEVFSSIYVDLQILSKPTGCKYISNPSSMRLGLIDGLAQAEVDCLIPNLVVHRSLDAFFKYDTDKLFPPDQCHRFIAHPILPLLPGQITNEHPSKRLFRQDVDHPGDKSKSRAVIAIGPEGGWENSEIETFSARNFKVVNAGNRILRTDIAVSLLK